MLTDRMLFICTLSFLWQLRLRFVLRGMLDMFSDGASPSIVHCRVLAKGSRLKARKPGSAARSSEDVEEDSSTFTYVTRPQCF